MLRNCSPHIHPHRWLGVNSIVLVWSLILMGRIWTTYYHSKEQVEFEYLVYNFGTCAVWLIEVTFNVLDHLDFFDLEPRTGTGEESLLQPQTDKRDKTKKEVAAIYIELILAAYFFIDSTSVAYHLSRKQIHREAKGMTLDVSLSMIAYTYLVYQQFIDYRST